MLTYDELIAEIQAEFPDFKIVPKEQSVLMRGIDKFLWLVTAGKMSTFMTTFTTTIGRTIYTPTKWESWKNRQRIAILRHERVHLRQGKKYGAFLFGFLYLFVPLPIGLAWFRAKFEKEAYEESIRSAIELYGVAAVNNRAYRESIVQNFVGPSYAWMWPFRGSVERWYDEAVKRFTPSR
jgi:hypothetical protein